MSTQEAIFHGENIFTIEHSRRRGPRIFTEKILRGLQVGPGAVFPISCGPVTQRGHFWGVGVQPIQILSAHHGPALGGGVLEILSEPGTYDGSGDVCLWLRSLDTHFEAKKFSSFQKLIHTVPRLQKSALKFTNMFAPQITHVFVKC